MAGYTISPRARNDMIEIWRYIARDNSTAAERLSRRFHQEFNRLSKQPHLDVERLDLSLEKVRFWLVSS